MKNAASYSLAVATLALAACSNGTPALPQTQSVNSSGVNSSGVGSSGVTLRSARLAGERLEGSSGLTELFNLDYSSGTITVFSIKGKKATVATQFTPGSSSAGAQGLAADAHGNIYTTLSEASGSPCTACVQIYSNTGQLESQLDAPTLPSASGSPMLTDISVDARDNVYVSDFGQDAVYYFAHAKMTKSGPTIVVQNYHNAASVSSQPDGKNVLVSGGCGFAAVAPFTRNGRGKHATYTVGTCFGIATIALIGGALDNREEVMTPVDGVFGLVSVSSPNGGSSFYTPDRMASVSGVAFNGDASIAYVANAAEECVYAFARPAGGWLSQGQPKLLATYKGFKNLDIIAVPQ